MLGLKQNREREKRQIDVECDLPSSLLKLSPHAINFD